MALTWTSLTGDDDRLKASHIQEVVDNIHLTEDLLELDDTENNEKYDFESGMDPFDRSVRNPMSVTDFQDLRDAVDYMDDSNICRTHYSSKHITYDNDQHATHDGVRHITYLYDYHGTHRSTHYYGYDNNRHGTYRSNHNGGYDSGDDSGVDGTYNSGYHSTNYSTDYSGDD